MLTAQVPLPSRLKPNFKSGEVPTETHFPPTPTYFGIQLDYFLDLKQQQKSYFSQTHECTINTSLEHGRVRDESFTPTR